MRHLHGSIAEPEIPTWLNGIVFHIPSPTNLQDKLQGNLRCFSNVSNTAEGPVPSECSTLPNHLVNIKAVIKCQC